jgi:hypothetical protein
MFVGEFSKLVHNHLFPFSNNMRLVINQREQLEIMCGARILPWWCTMRATDNSLRPSCELIYAESSLRNFEMLCLRACARE